MTSRRRAVVRRGLALAGLAALACGPAPAPPAPAAPRAILASFDAISLERALATVDPAAIPALRALAAEGGCAAGARPMFPSVTAASHAAIWTGAYGNVNGIAANSFPPLPWGEYALTETVSGYLARQLRAEPIWLAAARAGRRAVGHHVTQAPQAPGRWEAGGGRDTAAARADSAALADPRLLVLNGYDAKYGAGRVLTARDVRPGPAPAWRGVGGLASRQPPRELAWTIGDDSVFALAVGDRGYEALLVATTRDVARAVRVTPAPAERAPVHGRDLARRFGEPLWLPRAPGRAATWLRLWALAPDLSSLTLLSTGGWVVQANDSAGLAEYHAAVGPFLGNSETRLYERGALGPMLQDGGDGEAELRYLETTELVTRQFMRGSAWAWRARRPDLLADYLPVIDEIDHLWFGLVSPEVPGHDAALAAQVAAMRNRGWALADRRLAGLRELAREGDALLLVTGDHGMRPTWRLFHPGAALRRAGLLATDASGTRVDLARTRAAAPAGFFVSVNRAGRRGGIVPEDSVDAVARAAEAALLAVRDARGAPVVTRTWRPAPDDSLGIGGPAGGEVYFALAPGTYIGWGYDSVLTARRTPTGSHGFPSVEPDMRTAFCAAGPGIGGAPPGVVRIIDAAPTVAEWLGIPPPREARGRSLLAELRAARGAGVSGR